LGVLAQAGGDYAEAERRYQQALASFEQLSNQAGLATGHHQLGTLAQARGDYAEAERRYQQALAIKERLGDQAGIAATSSQLGVLRTATGDPAEAIQLHIQAAAIRLAIGSPQAAIDLNLLAELRTTVGITAFSNTATEILDRDSYQNLTTVLDSLTDQTQRPSATTP
jgi:tetratricopeptide (TPR) repeat protein